MNKVSNLYDTLLSDNIVDRFWSRIGRDEVSDAVDFAPLDYIIAAIFAAIALAIAVHGFSMTSTQAGLLEYKNIWFQADIARVIDNMTNIGGSHWRTSVHPITSIIFYPIGFILTRMGITPLHASRIVVDIFSALNGALFFLVLRQMNLPRLVASLFTGVLLASAAFIFWTSVIELYPIACTSLLPALFLMARGPKGARWWWVLASAFTLSITVTNWVVGLIATLVRWKLKDCIFISGCALAIVLALSIAQFFIFKDARIFIDPRGLKWDAVSFSEPVMEERGQLHEGWKPLRNIEVLLVTSAIATPAKIEEQGKELIATNQGTGFERGNFAGPIATAAWGALLGLGIWGSVRRRELRIFSIGVALMLLANCVLHSVYGEVTFLYGMHIIPLLAILGAMSWFSPYKWAGVGLALVVIIAGGSSNLIELRQSANLAGQIAATPGVSTIQTYVPGG